MENTYTLKIGNNSLILFKEKVVYWPKQEMLMLADLHAGKAAHFRKNGMPLSTDYLLQDLNTIERLIDKTGAKKLSFLGDLFHSTANEENKLIDAWVADQKVKTELVLGNHDLYSYSSSKIESTPSYIVDDILLSHEPEDNDAYNICGHLHPAYLIGGKARTSLKFPCFYASAKRLILPAFGSVNGGRVYKDIIRESRSIITTPDGLVTVD